MSSGGPALSLADGYSDSSEAADGESPSSEESSNELDADLHTYSVSNDDKLEVENLLLS